MSRVIDRLEDDRFAAHILGRELVSLPRAGLQEVVEGRTALITGAGGYIGSALARLIAGLGLEQIILAENSEHALYEIDRELRSANPGLRVQPVICDIRDSVALDRLFAKHRPEIVFHAAALKHLPLTEANPREAILTNIIGTANLVACCREAGTAALIHISSDKGAAPTSMLGKTKRVAELVCQAGDNAGYTRCSSVRFNNVFGSTGSVVPLFLDQIAKGRSLTITHPAMNRYFVTASEATQLVIAALGISLVDGAMERPVYILETGTPMAIVDLARRILADAGRDENAELMVIGMRRGEKLDESLTAPWEYRLPTKSPLISVAIDKRSSELDADELVAELGQACARFDEARLRALLDAATCQPAIAEKAGPGRAAA